MSGPYETEAQAHAEPMPRAMCGPRVGRESMHDIRLGFLLGACEAASVEVGACDRRKLVWLANWESDTVPEEWRLRGSRAVAMNWPAEAVRVP